MPIVDKYPCPACGHLVNDQMPGNHEVCPICGWQDELAQLRFPLMPGNGNRVTLQEAQINYMKHGAAERSNKGQTREPFHFEGRDQGWRPLDEARDNIEHPHRGEDYASTYPWNDTTVLYYWRSTYWRRIKLNS